MKARDIQPGVTIEHSDIRLVVIDVRTSDYDEEAGKMTAITCYEESTGNEVNLVFEPGYDLYVFD